MKWMKLTLGLGMPEWGSAVRLAGPTTFTSGFVNSLV